jgi:hypothetical protein
MSVTPASPPRGGFARVDITPGEPVTMSGYADRKGLSQGVQDPLSARAVAFESDGERLVLVSTDVIGFYGDTADSVPGYGPAGAAQQQPGAASEIEDRGAGWPVAVGAPLPTDLLGPEGPGGDRRRVGHETLQDVLDRVIPGPGIPLRERGQALPGRLHARPLPRAV